MTRNGTIATAHPTKIKIALTFYLKTGKALPLSSLFRKGVDWKRRLEREVAARKRPVDPPRGPYGGYLTGRKRALCNLSDAFAAVSVEVPIPLGDMTDALDRGGPIGPVLGP